MQKLGSELSFTLITEPQLEGKLSAFTEQDSRYDAARSAVDQANRDWPAAQEALYAWLLAASSMLTIKWGTRWSTQWAQAGFITPTTAIPAKIEDRLGLALALVNFFTTQPTYQVPDLKLTAAEGKRLRNAVLVAQQAITTAEVAFKNMGAPWQTAYDGLVKGMRDLVMNLTSVLAKNDPRWEQFGLQMPISKTTPGQPQNVVLQLDSAGALLASCDPNALTTRYRWRTLIVGMETEYRLAASTKEPLASLSRAQPGQTVQLVVQAVNNTLQSVASEPVFFTMPMLAPKAEPQLMKESAPAARRETNGHGNGNGNGNGHGNGNGNGNGHGHGHGQSSRA